mgnify:CR=1 FL=1
MVIEKFSKRVIGGAVVDIGGYSTVTDFSGIYILDGLPIGAYNVTISAPEHESVVGMLSASNERTYTMNAELPPIARAF